MTRSVVASLLSLMLLLTAARRVEAVVAVSLSEKGFVIDAGGAGTYTLAYPALDAAGKMMKPQDGASIGPAGATVSYANGARLLVQPRDGQFLLQFTSLPDDVKGMKLNMTLPIELKRGGTWSMDGSAPTPFPAEKGSDPFLSRGNAQAMTLRAADGQGFTVTLAHGYQQLQDNRHWGNTQSFGWMASTQLPRANGNESYFQLGFAGPDGEAAMLPAATTDEAPPAAAAIPDASVSVALDAEGVQIKAGTAGTFRLKYPTLKGLESAKPISVSNTSPQRTILTYAGGATAQVSLVNGRDVKIELAGLPASAETMRVEMMIPFTMTQGGRYAIGGEPAQPFPADKPEDPFLYRGAAGSFTLIHPTGPGFTLTLPKFGYQQLQDNREWNWTVFAWFAQYELRPGAPVSFTIGIGDLPGGPAKSEPVIDRFGQWVKADYPTKVHSEEELLADAEADQAYYASLNPPATDPYGGIPGTREQYGLEKTGFFHLGKVNGADVLVTPDGNAFFQLGVCGLTPLDEYTTVRGRESIYAWLPPANDPQFKTAWRPNDPGVFSFHVANHIRKTGEPYDKGAYAAMWIDRLRQWGFNSGGAWAYGFEDAAATAMRAKQYPYVMFLSQGKLPRLPGVKGVWDPFTRDAERIIDEAMGKQMAEHADDPLIIGWFNANEPLIEDVPKVVPTLKASEWPAKARLVERLREKYRSIDACNAAWGTDAASFEDLGERSLTITTSEAADDMQAYFAEFLDRRYGLIRTAFKKHNPNHLMLGDRWMPGTANNELLVRTAGKYLDVVSVNYYTYGIDRNLMDRIHEWSGGQPMLLSEFFFSSPNESGLHGGRSLESQTLRGKAYRHYVEQAAALGYVVGVQWFEQIDQASTGRFFEKFNGEAANTGLVNVADRPYKDFLAQVMRTNYEVLAVVTGEREPFLLDDPRFTFAPGGARKTVVVNRMVNTVELDGSRGEWPTLPPYRIEPKGGDFEGTFRLAWDNDHLYLYIEVTDPTPMRNSQPGSSLWNGDAVELFVGTDEPDRAGTMMFSDRQVLIRGARAEGQAAVHYINAPGQVPTRSVVVPQIDGKGYVVEAAIPFAALGFEPSVHQELLFDVAIDNGDGKGRTRQLVFNGSEQASKDRGVWGRAQLVN